MPVIYELFWYMVRLEQPDTIQFNIAITGIKFGAEDVTPQGINMSAPISEVADAAGKFNADDIVKWVMDKKGQVVSKRKVPLPVGGPQ